ncbi:MAG: hypothetical protein Q9171_001134 [Xanthocarpia ochracea]
MSQFHWPLLRETSLGFPPGSTLDLLPRDPTKLPEAKLQEHRTKEALEAFFEDYSKLNNGIVAAPDDIGSQCELQFLQAMWRNTRLLSRCMTLDMPHDQKKYPDLDLAISIVLDETCVQVKRLVEHPELLPPSTGRFLELMEEEFELLLSAVQLKQKEGQELQETIKKQRKRILTDYDEDRTVWQQFLHDKAPGSGFPKDQMYQHGCTQMATAASRLTGKWTRAPVRPHTYRVNLINDLAITEMRRLINLKLAESRDRT